MNERILELLKQAEETNEEYQDESRRKRRLYNEILLPKFAELIVRECANHCDLLLDHKISSEWSRGTHDCSRAIKKHFGVEE